MAHDIAFLIVHLMGGFWKYRQYYLRKRDSRSGMSGIIGRIYYLYQERYGAFIGHTATFASVPCFPHNLFGVFVAGGVRIGRNCVIFQHVTIGANSCPIPKRLVYRR